MEMKRKRRWKSKRKIAEERRWKEKANLEYLKKWPTSWTFLFCYTGHKYFTALLYLWKFSFFSPLSYDYLTIFVYYFFIICEGRRKGRVNLVVIIPIKLEKNSSSFFFVKKHFRCLIFHKNNNLVSKLWSVIIWSLKF